MKPTNKTYRELQALILKSEGPAFHGLNKVPITGERVLRALGRCYVIDGEGEIIRLYDGGQASCSLGVGWTLCLPAEFQEEETLLKLIEILS